MPRRSNAADMLPPPVERALITLGEHLYIARKRRKQTLSSFADRMQVSVPTLRKKELHGEQGAVRLDLSTKCAQACAMRHTRFDRWSAVLVFLRGQMASEQKRICSVAGSAA